MKKKFKAYFYFVGWDCLSLGFHICTSQPNMEIHVPFGFIRIGWEPDIPKEYIANWKDIEPRTFYLIK